jgi:hypothetical protein
MDMEHNHSLARTNSQILLRLWHHTDAQHGKPMCHT